MKCPEQLARDLSAQSGLGVKLPARQGGRDEAVLRGGGGADDESPRSDFTSAGQADHVVAGGRDSGDFRPQHAALAGTLPEARLRWAVGPASGEAESKAGAGRDGRKGAGALSGEIFRPQRATLPREIEGGARDGVELHLGEAGAAGSGAGEEGAEARDTSQAAAAAPSARHAAAPGRQPPSLVSG